MERTPYIGNEIRTDGYYYSNKYPNSESIGVALFYKNGFCIYLIGSFGTPQMIEEKVLLNQDFISKMYNEPHSLGVFRVTNKNNIEMETFMGRGFTNTYHTYGHIINDTTFIITKTKGIEREETDTNLKFKFKKFSPKPDSTCVHIK
ncbi:hypothetical protein [Capnocytophaga stomatis]|uniref:Lipocalin-like domain-containing protein n=1 Tax=Capnocytophaga stomatis TaxID=1848904 RepID=A0ABW8QBU5_9FLAO|nr:hypothetical protein [Capnocytophaga stomatis]GIJ94797.1 hypothetical protein CAPN002_20150 [Capnocytophaga stomatis]